MPRKYYPINSETSNWVTAIKINSTRAGVPGGTCHTTHTNAIGTGRFSKTNSKHLKSGNGNQKIILVDFFRVGNVFVADGNWQLRHLAIFKPPSLGQMLTSLYASSTGNVDKVHHVA